MNHDLIYPVPLPLADGTMTPAARLTFVIVDDDFAVRKALTRQLRALGHTAASFGSAEEFLAQHVDFDCLILDVHLPGLSGIELAKLLGRMGPPPSVVFITGREESAVREYATRVSAPWLRKPFDEEALTSAIQQAVSS